MTSSTMLAVVVGAGAMGLALARRLGESHRLLLVDRDAAHLDSCLAVLRDERIDVAGCVADVTDRDSIARVAETARAAGPIGALVHVVGLSPGMADFAAIMSVNLIGATHVADLVAPLIAPGGAAVFVGSIAAYRIDPDPALVALTDAPLADGFLDRLAATLGADATPAIAYRLSKAAMLRLCAQRAATLGAAGIRIVSLSPGLIDSPMGARESGTNAARQAMFDAIPLGRQGRMDDIADAAAFLVSDRARFISGIDLLVDGGLAAALRHG